MMQTMVKQHDGWTCRTWVEENGEWTSEFDTFRTQEEAEEYGRVFLTLIRHDETAREYEIYKHFPDPFHPVEV